MCVWDQMMVKCWCFQGRTRTALFDALYQELQKKSDEMFCMGIPSSTKESSSFFRRTFGGGRARSGTDPSTPTNSSRKSNGSHLFTVGETEKVRSFLDYALKIIGLYLIHCISLLNGMNLKTKCFRNNNTKMTWNLLNAFLAFILSWVQY